MLWFLFYVLQYVCHCLFFLFPFQNQNPLCVQLECVLQRAMFEKCLEIIGAGLECGSQIAVGTPQHGLCDSLLFMQDQLTIPN